MIGKKLNKNKRKNSLDKDVQALKTSKVTKKGKNRKRGGSQKKNGGPTNNTVRIKEQPTTIPTVKLNL
ncbi:MAG: hypothetical protein QMC27_07740, partial [Flavobacteriaceae bacterium]